MRHQDRTGREQRLWELANAQFGLVRLEDLREAGLSTDAIKRRVAARRLTRVHDTVFAWGHTSLRRRGEWLAAQWACGRDSVLSHRTAGAFHRMMETRRGDAVDVSTLREITTRAGITAHRVRYLARTDVFHLHPFSVTSIPRTLVDLADVLEWTEFRAAADRISKLHLPGIREAQERAPGRRGAPLVRRLVESDESHTKSEFERRYLRFCKSHSLARPDDLNRWVAGHKADCVYDRESLIVELDGRAYHQRRAEMQADRERDVDYQLARYLILRLVWDDLHPDAAPRTVHRIRRMLAGVAR